MGYMHIDNLYRNQAILAFRECYALEKLHGTSAHVKWNEGRLTFFSGGANSDSFNALFDATALAAGLREMFGGDCLPVTVFGEAYGGKMQGMKDTYGPVLKFAAFDVQTGERWLAVERAAEVAAKLGLEFVHYRKIPTDLPAIDAERDADSEQAVRNGMGPGKMREGVVLRPPFEVRLNNGARIIAKHKRAEFCETRTPRAVDPAQQVVLADAEKIADEWVTPMRLQHVLDRLPEVTGIEHTGAVIKAMVEDVLREAGAEIVDSKAARKAIGSRAAQLYKQRVTRVPATQEPRA